MEPSIVRRFLLNGFSRLRDFSGRASRGEAGFLNELVCEGRGDQQQTTVLSTLHSMAAAGRRALIVARMQNLFADAQITLDYQTLFRASMDVTGIR